MFDQVLHVNKYIKLSTALSLSTCLTDLTFLKLRMNQPVRRKHKYMVIIGQCNSRLLSKSVVNNRAFSLDFYNSAIKTHRPSHRMPGRDGRKTALKGWMIQATPRPLCLKKQDPVPTVRENFLIGKTICVTDC